MTKWLTYAVTDLHGRFDLFEEARAEIIRHANGRTAEIVYLGDYVDRGPESAEIIQSMIDGIDQDNITEVFLKGNHEEMFVDAIDVAQRRPEDYQTYIEYWNFMRNGGDTTVASYGLDINNVPKSHIDFLKSLLLYYETDTHVFVHAGIPPISGKTVAELAEQYPSQFTWIRGDFLRANHDFGKHVVHGHTPDEHGPQLLSNRTNLDVGAVWTDRLVVGVFEPGNTGSPDQILTITVPKKIKPLWCFD